MDFFFWLTLLSLPSYIGLYNLFFYWILFIQNLSFTTVFDGRCTVVAYIGKTSIIVEITKQSMFDAGADLRLRREYSVVHNLQ
jgi:hypothetical protein